MRGRKREGERKREEGKEVERGKERKRKREGHMGSVSVRESLVHWPC